MHEGFGCFDSSEQTVPQWENIAIFGASINRIGFGAYYTITIVRNPYNPILIIKAPILCATLQEARLVHGQLHGRFRKFGVPHFGVLILLSTVLY